MNTTGLTLEGCTICSWVDGGGESGEAEALGYSIQNDGSYIDYNADGLLAWNKAAQYDESINCTLTADIDLTGRDWTRIDGYKRQPLRCGTRLKESRLTAPQPPLPQPLEPGQARMPL